MCSQFVEERRLMYVNGQRRLPVAALSLLWTAPNSNDLVQTCISHSVKWFFKFIRTPHPHPQIVDHLPFFWKNMLLGSLAPMDGPRCKMSSFLAYIKVNILPPSLFSYISTVPGTCSSSPTSLALQNTAMYVVFSLSMKNNDGLYYIIKLSKIINSLLMRFHAFFFAWIND